MGFRTLQRLSFRHLYNVRFVTTRWQLWACVLCMCLEVLVHIRSFATQLPRKPLDPPFHVGCVDAPLNTMRRANATLVMLARNSEVDGAVHSVRSVQSQFNDAFNYPWVFLNDEPWSDEFVENVQEAIGGQSRASFETIPPEMWGYPEWIDQDKARKKMHDMQENNIMYAGVESYHHMCRFQSGWVLHPVHQTCHADHPVQPRFFYDHHALQSYRWYWRVEPSISFTCAITYDPFIEMERNHKTYGYTIALWEKGTTVPSLFRKLSEYKSRSRIAASSLWTAMIDPSYLPWPFRRLLRWSRNRDEYGDIWNMCHFWSNFEIADMDFFRSNEYRALFQLLDEDGGFYYERWGDAPIHSLAAAMLLKPEQLHHFSDFGYVHSNLQYCTHAPTQEAKWRGEFVPTARGRGKELGCRCDCDKDIKIVEPTCFNRIKQTTG